MSKTNVHKIAEDLYAASASLAEKVRGDRLALQSHLNMLRDLETRIRAHIREEQIRQRAAAEAEAAARAAEEALQAAAAQEQEPDKPVETAAIHDAPQKEAELGQTAVQDPAAPKEDKAQRKSEQAAEAPPTHEAEAKPVPSEPQQPVARDELKLPESEQLSKDAEAQRKTGAPPAARTQRREGAPRPSSTPGAYSTERAAQPGGGRRSAPLPRAAGAQASRREGFATRAPGQTQPPRGPRTGAAAGRPRPGGSGRTTDPLNLRKLTKELAPVQEKERASNYNPNKKAYARDKDITSARARKNKKQLMREQAPFFNDEEIRFRKKRRRQQQIRGIEKKVIEHAVISTEMVSIKALSEKIGVPAAEIIKKLLLLGTIATINQEIDFDTAVLIAGEFNVTLEQKLEKTYEEVMMDSFIDEDESGLVERPPVVTIMGHVDHGKTSLLDVLRQSRVAETEAGGITQHIGAYMINVDGKAITFLDTPGHEAFTAMRSRGAQVTDIAVLVVAANDGVKPQTIEAINHARAAKVPIIAAINKMDLPAADADRVRRELMEHGLVPEEWGGDNMMVEVSAHTGMGIDKLLESILLLAEIEDLTANPDARATGTVIEAKLDRGRGPVATVIISNGTLRIGDTVVAGTTSGRIRDMLDESGNHVEEATPSMPVEIVGFSQVPEAGDILYTAEGDRLARRVAQEREERIKVERMKAASKVTLDDLFSKIAEDEIKTINIIVRGDVQGSVEAVKQALEKLSTDEVKIQCIHDGVGAITENDVMLASASDAIIIGFNVRPDANGREAADREKVDVRLYRIIYNAIEDMQKAIRGMLAPEIMETVLGHAQVRDVFHITGVGTVAGGYVTDGVIRRNAKVRILRDSVVIHEGMLSSLKRFKDDVREVASGYECGIGVSGFNDIKQDDVIEAYIMEEIQR
ncbi:MAG: translation initiation factor IF-2 [Christensenellales bacterium]|jgi:translation initiation factor IF-2